MIRAVLDVNVIVSGFPAAASVPGQILLRWAAYEFELILSEHILDGVARAWLKPYYLARYTAAQAEETLALLRRDATSVVPVLAVRGVADDEEDDLVLATGVAGQASHVVTGDKGLQALRRYQDMAILSPREFLDLLLTLA